jgi:hypothetical protein
MRDPISHSTIKLRTKFILGRNDLTCFSRMNNLIYILTLMIFCLDIGEHYTPQSSHQGKNFLALDHFC